MAYRLSGKTPVLAGLLAIGVMVLAACATGNEQQPIPSNEGSELIGRTTADSTDEEVQTADDLEEYSGEVPAPEFPSDLEWLNVPAPLTMEALRGKVVLIDFWTYGCINCIHMLPTLAQLEEKYADELVIISVHSAKFTNEGETENLRQIVQRYGIHHPVINDDEFLVWRAYGITAWPSFALIDPRGQVLVIDAGEIPYAVFDRVIGGMVAAFDSLGEIDRAALTYTPVGADAPDTPLLFPGKVLADEVDDRLFIADSNHHRIVVADLVTYEVLSVIGTGQRGLVDGAFDAAMFNQPQGMALDGSTLYVADTSNHAIRAIDLDTRMVRTIAGTGEQGQGPPIPGLGARIDNPVAYALRSPWDVALVDGTLYIAMAGTHQIWALDLDGNILAPAVGSAREGLHDGSLANSELAQPSGLHYTGGLLYFADSESSSVRVADLGADEVRTLAGPLENNLFDFGDVDGPPGQSRLQHPLGVTGGPENLLYVADTYNSKIKILDLTTDELRSFLGLAGSGGFRDGGPDEAQFDEPGGLDYAAGRLYVADTNNHAIRAVDLETGFVSTVMFPNPEALRVSDEVLVAGGNQAAGAIHTLGEQAVAPGEGEVVLRLALPENFKINDLVDSTGVFSAVGSAVQIEAGHTRRVIDGVEVRIPAVFAEGSGTVLADLTLYYCREGEEALCFVDMVRLEAPVAVTADAEDSTVTLEHAIEPPDASSGGF